MCGYASTPSTMHACARPKAYPIFMPLRTRWPCLTARCRLPISHAHHVTASPYPRTALLCCKSASASSECPMWTHPRLRTPRSGRELMYPTVTPWHAMVETARRHVRRTPRDSATYSEERFEFGGAGDTEDARRVLILMALKGPKPPLECLSTRL